MGLETFPAGFKPDKAYLLVANFLETALIREYMADLAAFVKKWFWEPDCPGKFPWSSYP